MFVSAMSVTFSKEDEEEKKIGKSCLPVFRTFVIFSLHTVIFPRSLHLDVLRRQIDESENFFMYGSKGGPVAIPMYKVLPYCVVERLWL